MSEQRFQILHRGQRWNGNFTVENGEVRVSSAYGSGHLPLGRRKPHAVAGEILFGLIDDWCGVARTRVPPARLAQTQVFKFQS